jgi:predicted amidohydrolase
MGRYAKISLVSYPTLPPDEPDRLTKTLERMGRYVDDAAAVQSDLVAFPEICNTLGAEDSWQFEELDGPTLAAMSAKAEEHGIYVVCPLGLYDRDGNKRNASVLINRNGTVDGIYFKNFPTHGELDIGIIPGTETPVFETDFGRVGLCICFDLNYWEVGSGLCANRAELVIWSSMWDGARMLTKWAIEFGFSMGGLHSGRSTFVDVCGRPVLSVKRDITDQGGRSPVVTAALDLDRRLLHHDYNIEKLKPLYEKYGPTAAFAEWINEECLLVFGSELHGVTTDQLITEFGLETMRDYLARARRDRLSALAGNYPQDEAER